MGACASCGANIRWVKTEYGKAMPIDFDPSPRGNIAIIDGLAVVDGKAVRLDDKRPRYTSHFATCPNASAHRKRR